MPMIAFIGVRISWLMLARNSPLAMRRLLGALSRDVELADELRQPFRVFLLLVLGAFHLARVHAQRILGRAAIRHVAGHRVDELLVDERRGLPLKPLVGSVLRTGSGSRSR